MEKKIANLPKVSTSFLSPYFCNCPFSRRRCCKTSICISCYRSRWFICTKAMKLSALTSPPSTSCTGKVFLTLVEHSCWFSSISPFYHIHQIYKTLCIFSWGILTIHDSVYRRDALPIGYLYCHNELTAWKDVPRSFLSTKFLKTISVLMKALSYKIILLILNVSIVS